MAPMMRVVFICQIVDESDPVHASTVTWLKVLARKSQVEHVSVIALRKGVFTLPENVSVRAIKSEHRFSTLMRFYQEILRLRPRNIDSFFIYQGGPYPLLLLPFKLFLGKPIFQWKAHPHITPMMKFYARFCNNIVFTSTRNAFPLNISTIKVIGQGVDTTRFCIKPTKKTGDLVTVGRVAPAKRLDVMLRALAHCNHHYASSCRLDIYGPTLEGDRNYRKYLESLIRELDLSSCVFFRGSVLHDRLPEILNSYRLFLNFSATALDRSVVEAMACGLPVISTNPCVEEVVSQNLKTKLVVPAGDLLKQAKAIRHLLSLGNKSLTQIGQTLRHTVVREHGIEALTDKIVAEMGVHQ
jgi:glycosyltransferase involved in cell wall biosynthesis